MAITQLWVDKYKPTSLETYVFQDEAQKTRIKSWIADKSIPHLLFSGGPGCGKSSCARVLISELDIPDMDVLEINASRDTGIREVVRERISSFVQTIAFGPFKIILLDEADRLSIEAQDALKGIMEEYSQYARFILTCNSPNRIVPALHSRCQHLHFANMDKMEYTSQVATILVKENIDFDLDTLDTFVKIEYPDLRKCINSLQLASINGTLQKPIGTESGGSAYKVAMVELFKQGKITEARKLICSKSIPEDHESIYTWLYHNIEIFGDEDKQDSAILIIRKGLVNHTLVADTEINLSATMIELSRI
jgi:replication factor C small subunit